MCFNIQADSVAHTLIPSYKKVKIGNSLEIICVCKFQINVFLKNPQKTNLEDLMYMSHKVK